MAKKQESEKFTGFVGEYTWGNKTPFNFKASPLPIDPNLNPYTGVDAGAFLPAKGGGVRFEPPVGQSTVTSNTPPAAKAVRHRRKIVSGIYEIIRPIFNFDFTDPEEYGDAKLHNVRKIQKAKVVLNVESVGTKATGLPAPSTSITIALMCTKLQPNLRKVQGKGGASKTIYRLPPAAQYFALGGIAQEHPSGLGATSKIISSTNTLSVGNTGQIGFNLPRPMLNELEAAMQQRRYFSVFVVDQQTYKGAVAVPDFAGLQEILFYGASKTPALQPILDFTYKIDNSKIHTGGGITRTSKAGFMMEDVFAGTNSGFSS